MLVRTNGMRLGQLPGFPQNVFVMPPAPAAWEMAPQYAPMPQAEGMSFGTFLAGLTTLVGGVVLFDAKSSKQAKAVAQMALGVSVPHLLGKAFDQQPWPGQWN